MKKVMLAVVLVVAVVVLLYGVVLVLTESKRETIAERWRTLESDEALAAKFPEIREANDVATKLETAAIPLGIVLTPMTGVEQPGEVIINTKAFEAFKKASGDWEAAIIESVDDGIAPIPPEVAGYLGDHRAEIDAISSVLTADGPPRWPMLVDGPAALRPIPNLLGQMNLGRALAAASFEAQLAGDRDRAWRYEQAQWTVAKGLLARPEMISQLIGIALSRRVAGVARKLDGPAPPWFEEMERFDFHRAMLDACRGESSAFSEALSGDAFLEGLRASAQSGNAEQLGVIRDLATRSFIAW